jgi:nicotinamidase-related amidase
MGEGYDVYVVTDASGGVSPEAHDMAIRRVVAAGAQPNGLRTVGQIATAYGK